MFYNYIISQLKVPVTKYKNIDHLLKKKLMRDSTHIKSYKITNKSIDARNKTNILFVFNIEITTSKKLPKKINNINIKEKILSTTTPIKKVAKALEVPLIVGMGPAGLFCALNFVEHGIPVKIIDRGKSVEDRVKDIELFWATGKLEEESNALFGEGGAGTFSDGKLNTQINSPYIREIKEMLVDFGAPEEISYDSKPHIGSDRLRKVLINIRKYLTSNNCEVIFNAKLEEIVIEENVVSGAIINGKKHNHKNIFMAIGHSAHDTYKMLYNKKILMEAKPFAIGFRIEHPQELINKIQFGDTFYNNPLLGASPYKLTYKDEKTQRSVFSFCMCPGGSVICASNQKDKLVINGMSNYKRDSGYANSAIVVSIKPDDYYIDSPLDGIKYIEKFEEAAYKAGGEGFKAPAQNLMDYLEDKDAESKINSTYQTGITPYNLNNIYDSEINNTIKRGLISFDKRMKGFVTKEATLTGVETRTSAPLRIIRDYTTFKSNIDGIYPIGEGAGYAGGIMSAAVDGFKSAAAYIKDYYC